MRLQAAVGCETKKKPPHSPFSHQDAGYGLMLHTLRLNSGLWPLTQPFLHQNAFPPLSWLPPLLLGSCKAPSPPFQYCARPQASVQSLLPHHAVGTSSLVLTLPTPPSSLFQSH